MQLVWKNNFSATQILSEINVGEFTNPFQQFSHYSLIRKSEWHLFYNCKLHIFPSNQFFIIFYFQIIFSRQINYSSFLKTKIDLTEFFVEFEIGWLATISIFVR